MDYLHIHEHQICGNYTKREKPIIENRIIPKGFKGEVDIEDNVLIFVVEGDVYISYGRVPEENVKTGKIMLLPVGSKINFCALQKTTYTILRLQSQSNFDERLSYKLLLKDILAEDTCLEKSAENLPNYYLDMNNCLWAYINNLNARIQDGIKSTVFFELKLKELFFLLRAYYPKEELFRFFEPIVYGDHEFLNIIMCNFQKVKTVKELADLTNYSISGFEKRFKRVFNTSAGNWIKQQKSMNIFHEISMGDVSFKNICFKNGFSSLSHFNNYCKLHFGLTPGEIRKQQKMQINK